MIRRFVYFTTYISEIHRAIQKIKRAEMAEFGLKSNHVMCLFYLHQYPEGLTAAELSVKCKEDKAAISRCVADLEKRGYLNPACEVGVRKYRAKLQLTKQGDKVAQIIDKRITRIVNLVGEGLTQEQRGVFYEALKTVSHNLQRFCEAQEGEGQ